MKRPNDRGRLEYLLERGVLSYDAEAVTLALLEVANAIVDLAGDDAYMRERLAALNRYAMRDDR